MKTSPKYPTLLLRHRLIHTQPEAASCLSNITHSLIHSFIIHSFACSPTAWQFTGSHIYSSPYPHSLIGGFYLSNFFHKLVHTSAPDPGCPLRAEPQSSFFNNSSSTSNPFILHPWSWNWTLLPNTYLNKALCSPGLCLPLCRTSALNWKNT